MCCLCVSRCYLAVHPVWKSAYVYVQAEHLHVMHEQMDAMHGQQVRAVLAIEQGAQAMLQLHAAAGVLDGKLSESLAKEVRSSDTMCQAAWL